MDIPVDKLELFHCPERETHQPMPFIDYVHNTLLPEGPDVNGVWRRKGTNEGYRWIKIDQYKHPSSVVFICDAEREDKVENVIATGGAHPTVWAARMNWYAQNWAAGHIDVMDVRTGEHLPEGWGFNETDDVGLRRVARKIHLGRFTNAMFLDSHAEALQLANRATPRENYMVWLRRFGVRDPAQAADRDHR